MLDESVGLPSSADISLQNRNKHYSASPDAIPLQPQRFLLNYFFTVSKMRVTQAVLIP